jgi:pimeloyl-ACP methyl ester carboxylesterase
MLAVLEPSEAIQLAIDAYQFKDASMSELSRLDLTLPKSFTVGVGMTGASGLGFGTLSGFGFVANGGEQRKKEAIVAIRGTDGAADWLTDAIIGLGVPGPTGTMVHTGFNRTWRTLQAQVDRALPPASLAGMTVHCVGHSLGGALASLAADHLKRGGATTVKLYTFGSPRVGMIDFTKSLTHRVTADNIFRVYHPADPVPMVPVFPFTHLPAGRNGYALKCEANDRIRISAHYKMESYKTLVGKMTYDAMRNNGAQTLTDRQIEAWVRRVRAGGWVQNYGARTMEMIGVALDWVLRKILEGAMIGLQPYLAAGVGLLDALAYVLSMGVTLVKDVSWYVEGIMMAILKFIGRTVAKGVPLTLQFIRWALERMLREISAMARAAIGQN